MIVASGYRNCSLCNSTTIFIMKLGSLFTGVLYVYQSKKKYQNILRNNTCKMLYKRNNSFAKSALQMRGALFIEVVSALLVFPW